MRLDSIIGRIDDHSLVGFTLIFGVMLSAVLAALFLLARILGHGVDVCGWSLCG
jgi:hypothetical protein